MKFITHDSLSFTGFEARPVPLSNVRCLTKEFGEPVKTHPLTFDEFKELLEKTDGDIQKVFETTENRYVKAIATELLAQKMPFVMVEYKHGGFRLFLDENEKTKNIVENLDLYPLIDEMEYSEVENELIREAIDSFIKSDVMDHLIRNATSEEESDKYFFAEIDSDQFHSEFMSVTVSYGIEVSHESNSVSVDIEKVANAMKEWIDEKLGEPENKP